MVKNLKKYQQILISTLTEYAADFNQNPDGVEAKVIVDKDGGHFQLLNIGWQKDDYQFYVIFHFDIKNGKIWVQENRTDILIAHELTQKGIPKSDIVLGLQFPEMRVDSGCAVA
jgi:hypothetical protein